MAARPPSGPNDTCNADRLIAALDGLGLDVTTVMWLLMTLVTYVMGAVLREIQERRWRLSVSGSAALEGCWRASGLLLLSSGFRAG